jgi:N-acetylglucosamine malate deacetylase 1
MAYNLSQVKNLRSSQEVSMKVLAIGAHPDDLEILCGGTLALYRQKGHEVFMCHVCDGNKGSLVYTSEELAKIRRKEAIESAKLIGAESIWGGMSDLEVVLDMKSRLVITDVIRQANPDVIITHNPDDYHTDHINVSRLVFEASYMAGVKLLETDFPKSDKLPYLYYMDTIAGINFYPTEYVDITETIDIKIEMLMKMKSQLGWLKDMHDADVDDFTKTTAKFRGYQAGVAFAEAFRAQSMYPQGLTERILP